MQEETYRSHQGLQACLQRAREVFFWPGVFAQLKELNPVPDRPWQRVATGIFTFENRNYLVLVDYFSNFIELNCLPDTSSLKVIRKLKTHFARHGVQDCLVTDNGTP